MLKLSILIAILFSNSVFANQFIMQLKKQDFVVVEESELPEQPETPNPPTEPIDPVNVYTSCQDIEVANGTYTIYPNGADQPSVNVECVTFENGKWQKLARIYANKNTKTALVHNVSFQEAYVVHESYWISAYSDHRSSSQNNYVSINGVEYNPDVGTKKYANLGSKAVWTINYGNEGTYKGWQVSDDTGYFYANIYVR